MVAYLITVIAGFISMITCAMHFWVCFGANIWKKDSGTAYRKGKYKKVLIHLLITIALFILATHFACDVVYN